MKLATITTPMGIALTLLFLYGCSEIVPSSGGPASGARSTVRTVPIDNRQAERLKRIMMPLLQAADKRDSAKTVRIGLIDDPSINAANAGGGEFYVTTGLLQKASDEQLRGVLAHEIAHDDLGHVAKAQVLGAGLNIGVVLLNN
jgi:Zn-dependent protease with chaperone function